MGQLGKRGCPYSYCSAFVTTVTSIDPQTQQERTLLVTHDISNPILSGPCPASLMDFPLEAGAMEHLRERAKQDARKIAESYSREHYRSRISDVDESGRIRGPHRIGREPDDDSDDWFPPRDPT